METEKLQTAINTLEDFGDVLMSTLLPAFVEFSEGITDCFRQIYRQVGAPYGDTDEGFLNWLELLNQLQTRQG